MDRLRYSLWIIVFSLSAFDNPNGEQIYVIAVSLPYVMSS